MLVLAEAPEGPQPQGNFQRVATCSTAGQATVRASQSRRKVLCRLVFVGWASLAALDDEPSP